ncbi:MAG: SPOR domain-containing protein [Gammaproteobacteria bacterium]|nr:SPOR domain-containing protein [Gammaproteobacteria bacterium]
MARTNTRKKTKSRSRPNKPLPGWVWLATGLIIGLSATFLPSINEKIKLDQTENITKDKTPVAPVSKRTFDFYTILPELEVVVDKNSDDSSSNSNKELPAGKYVLQVGSFKSSDEADSLKAQLALMGVETNIEIVKVNTINWHRVRVGPSENIDQLQSTQKRLRIKNMDSILLKVRG